MSENKVHAKVNLSRLSSINRKGDELVPIQLETHVRGIRFTAKTYFYETPAEKAYADTTKDRKTKLLDYLRSLANTAELTTVEHITLD